MLETSLRPPSAVCASEIPSKLLRRAWSRDRVCARMRSEICRPAASSAAEAIRRPDDRRLKLLKMLSLARARFRWLWMLAIFVLMGSDIGRPLVVSAVPPRRDTVGFFGNR